MPRVHDVVPLLDVDGVVEALTALLQRTGSSGQHCPRAAPTQGVVSCTYEQWFKPYSPRRKYCQLPVSGRRMQRFLQFRLGYHGLPIATGRLAGAGHVDRANRVCLACNSGAIGDEKHMIFECTALAPLRACKPVHTCDRHHAILFRSAGLFGGFELCYRLFKFHGHMTLCIAVIGTSDQSCWLPEACKIPFSGSSRPLSVTVSCTVVTP